MGQLARRFPAFLIAGLAAALAVACGGSSSPTSPTSPSPPPGSVTLPSLDEMLADKTMGSTGAPNTIIEYSSFSCPHCANFHAVTLPELKTKHIDTGNARFIFRDFPLDSPSLQAGMLARCAGDARYFEVIEQLFRTETTWTSGSPSQGLATVMLGLGMSQATIDACKADSALQQGILKIQQDGQTQFGVNATPTFIVNGDTVVGNVPLSELEKHFK